MHFSDITTAVHDAWSFAWPPLVLCALAYLIGRHLHPEGTTAFLQQLATKARDSGAKLESLRTLLEPYGLTKLVPLVSLVSVVGLLYLLNGPLTVAVSDLPPYLSYRPARLILRGMSNDERLVLVRRYPTAAGVEEAFYLAVASADLESKDLDRTRRAELWYKIQNFLKFGFAATVVVWALSIRSGRPALAQLGRVICLLLILGALWVTSFAGLLYQEEQQIYDDWRPVKLSLQKDAAIALAAPVTTSERAKRQFDTKERWWRVYLVDEYRFQWIWRTFFRGD